MLTRVSYDTAQAAAANTQAYNNTQLSKTHAGEESRATLAGIPGDYTFVAAAELTSFNFSSDYYDSTEGVSVVLIVKGSPPSREAGQAAVTQLVQAASHMKVPSGAPPAGE